MKTVLFQPWIGEKYLKEGFKGKRILILGESHYCNGCMPEGVCEEIGDDDGKCDLPNLTIKLIENQISQKKRIRFVTKLENALAEAMDMQTDSKRVWDHVSFYNYIQQIAAPSPGIAPKKEMWEKAPVPFSEVLAYLKPDFMLVLSERLWNNMPGLARIDWPLYKEIKIDGKTECIFWHTIDKKPPLKMYSYHPRNAGFKDIIPFLKEAIRIITTEF